jgi:hypothetical protein
MEGGEDHWDIPAEPNDNPGLLKLLKEEGDHHLIII